MKSKFLIIVLIGFVFLSNCTSDLNNPDVCFQENVLPIFVSKCGMSGCHDQNSKKEEYILTSYEGIMKGIKAKHPLQSEIYREISGSNPEMPPKSSTQLTSKELAYIKIWIKMGAINSSNCSNCDTSLYTYSGKIKPLVDLWCTGCHNANNAGGGYNLSNYAGTAVVAANGSLLGSLQHAAGYSAMPKNTSKLSSCDISAVEKWINNGFPNN
jgi:hypothetical protein